MTDRDRYDCLRCDRTFLSEEALDRHYDRNPAHAEQFVIDADAIEADATTLPGEEWVETDETVETFMRVVEAASADEGASATEDTATEDASADDSDAAESSAPTGAVAGVEMTFDPDDASLVVHGARDQELDLSQFWEVVGDTLTWSFDGTYHKIQFHKDDER